MLKYLRQNLSSDASLNHRLASYYLPVRNALYKEPSDNRCLNLLVKKACAAMANKLKP